ncbi:hypothetical protein Tco_0818482 [Tanacetum coccineum]
MVIYVWILPDYILPRADVAVLLCMHLSLHMDRGIKGRLDFDIGSGQSVQKISNIGIDAGPVLPGTFLRARAIGLMPMID